MLPRVAVRNPGNITSDLQWNELLHQKPLSMNFYELALQKANKRNSPNSLQHWFDESSFNLSSSGSSCRQLQQIIFEKHILASVRNTSNVAAVKLSELVIVHDRLRLTRLALKAEGRDNRKRRRCQIRMSQTKTRIFLFKGQALTLITRRLAYLFIPHAD